MSDLHVEKGDVASPGVAADLMLLAGDVGWGMDGMAWLERGLAGRRAAMVAGNREYWHHAPGVDPIAALRARAAAVPGLVFLQDEAAVFDLAGCRLRVLGCTLWSDFALDGDAAAVMARAGDSMPDFRHGRGSHGGALTPCDVLDANRRSVAFLQAELAKCHDGPTVVVTHHLPSARSLAHRRPGHTPQAASVTALEALIEASGPELWVHGHSHADCDYVIGRTRIVSRQRGGPDNAAFTPLVLDLAGSA
jgi:hypothetical protein